MFGRSWSRRAVGAIAALAAIATGGCTTDAAFRTDEGLRVVTPAPFAAVQAPFTVQWEHDGDGQFAVFVDRAPIRPGQALADLATPECERSPGCPDEQYYADRGVYLTTDDRIVVEQLLPLAGSNGRNPSPVHLATIVRIAEGRRVGEAAWTVEFREAVVG